jgi:subtilisin-like proprotein convertase family protein
VIAVNTPSEITVTVLDASGTVPLTGIDVWAEGLDYVTTPVPTNAEGIAVITVDYPYGPQVDLVGQDPAETYRLFTKILRVNALPMNAPNLSVTTDIGLVDAFALNLPGTMHAHVDEPGHTVYAELPDGTLLSTQDLDLTLTPNQLGEVNGYIAVPGYNYYWEPFDIIEAFGTLTGTVSSGGNPLAGVMVRGYDAAMEMVFEVVTNASGAYDVGEEILVADYTIVVDFFGYLHYEEPFFLNYGANVYDIDLTPAPSGVLTGTVTEVGTGDPLQATLKVYRTDTGELYTETVSDPADGSYTTSALPYFDYEVKVRAFHHIPVTITITIDQAVVEKYFVLETTAGDILIIDDGAKSRPVPVKYDRKGQSIIAQPYVTQDSKTATDIVADLEELGYYATLEDVNATDPSTWMDYDLVICCSSNNTSALPNQATRNALVDFVNTGGHLLIEGGEVAYEHYSSDPAFCAAVLHITGWNHDSSGNLTVVNPDHYVMSVPNQITGINFTYNGYGDQDAVDVASDADRIGSWTSYPGDGSIIAYDTNPAPEGGQIVFFAFNYSAGAADGRRDLLENAVLWLITPEFGTASVSGTVTLHGEDDHSGVLVQAIPNGSSMVTGPDGTYTLPGLFHGEYMIVATRQGWATDSEAVTLEPDQHLTDIDFVLTPTSQVEVWDTPGLSIPDNNPIGVSSTIDVTVPGIVTAVEVFVDITHTYIGDLIVELTAPDGSTTVRLHNRTGGTTENINGWYPAEITPAEPLDGFNGVEMLGGWTLHVSDHANWDTGSLNEWCLRVTYGSPVSPIGEELLPTVLALGENFPNPFNPQTKIGFDLPVATQVDLAVYDVSGRRVTTLVADMMPAGRHFALWDGTDDTGRSVSSGVYFYRMIAGGQALTGKMMLLK